MTKKSKLLTEIGEIMKEVPINIEEFKVEILKIFSLLDTESIIKLIRP